MKLKHTLLAVVATSAIFSSLPCFAQGGPPEYENRLTQGSTVRNEQEAQSRAPGDAQELAPDTKQSATGGPSGGLGRGGAAGGS